MTYRDYVAELLEPSGNVTVRSMFGGYGIFESGDMFALITSEERLYFKVGDSNRAEYETSGSEQFGRMPYYEIPEEVVENADVLAEWAAKSIEIAHAAKSKKKRKKR